MTANFPSSPLLHLQLSRRRKSLLCIGLLLALSGIFLVACSSTQSSDPVAVVQTAYDHINKGEYESFMDHLTEDAVMRDACCRYASPSGILHHLTTDYAPVNMKFELSNFKADGNVVTYDVLVFQGDKLVAARSDALNIIDNGQILFDGTEALRLIDCKLDAAQDFCKKD